MSKIISSVFVPVTLRPVSRTYFFLLDFHCPLPRKGWVGRKKARSQGN
jgi:hypothetical protein